MADSFKGTFSLGLMSLKLQADTLMQDVGGNKTCEFLDLLSKLSQGEREVAIDHMTETLKALLSDERRLAGSDQNQALALENSLYHSIVKEIEQKEKTPRFEVVSGGKMPRPQPAQKTLVDLNSARRNRKSKADKQIN